MISKSSLGLIFFAVAGLAVTAILAGDNSSSPSSGMMAYFINGDNLVARRHSLDLSKPIFVSGATPVCASEAGLEHYTPSDPGDCAVINTGAQAGLVGIQTDGMRQPSFQLQMQTPNGVVKGWVDYNSLHN